ncbi:MAG: DUF4476 domain-containing protein [Ignavibacteria bacterium]|nr:DUF4476 domain-containing protein [Ignavibacteria bacterium]MCC7158607.1 DUF4476 domain-containing protein [Ignavibacteria bacterium]
MFTKLSFALILITLLFAKSYSQNSYLQLSLYDDGDFSVTFDNTQLSTGNYAEFDNVSPGEHSLKIVREGTNVPPQANVIFDGKIKIPAGLDLYAVIDEYNAFSIYKKKGYGIKRIFPSGESVSKCGDEGKSNNYKDKETYNVSDECRYKVMKNEDFKDLKGSVSNRSFETSNVSILKSAIDANSFTSEQLKELLGYFTFEDSKLEIAKYGYKKICDTKNFFKVYEAFTFDSSIEELKNYISGK